MATTSNSSFNIKELGTSQTDCIHVFHMVLMIHRQYIPKHYFISLYNENAVCFMWGRDYILKY
jgi:hypothetical protein